MTSLFSLFRFPAEWEGDATIQSQKSTAFCTKARARKQRVQSRQTAPRGRKQIFPLKNNACQVPYCCYKSAPAHMSCADNIPTVFAAPVFPAWSLGRPPNKAQAPSHWLPYTFPSLSLHHSHLPWASLLSIPARGVRTWSRSNNPEMLDEIKAKRVILVRTNKKRKNTLAFFLNELPSWALFLFLLRLKKKGTKRDAVPPF